MLLRIGQILARCSKEKFYKIEIASKKHSTILGENFALQDCTIWKKPTKQNFAPEMCKTICFNLKIGVSFEKIISSNAGTLKIHPSGVFYIIFDFMLCKEIQILLFMWRCVSHSHESQVENPTSKIENRKSKIANENWKRKSEIENRNTNIENRILKIKNRK